MDKQKYLFSNLVNLCTASEFGAASLTDLTRIAGHADITPEEVEQFLAALQARNGCKTQLSGRNYYIILTPQN